MKIIEKKIHITHVREQDSGYLFSRMNFDSYYKLDP